MIWFSFSEIATLILIAFGLTCYLIFVTTICWIICSKIVDWMFK